MGDKAPKRAGERASNNEIPMSTKKRTLKFEIRNRAPRALSAPFSRNLRSIRRITIFAAILIIINLIAHCLLPAQIDLTQRGVFTLAPQTCNLLASLKSPVDVVLLAPKIPKTA